MQANIAKKLDVHVVFVYISMVNMALIGIIIIMSVFKIDLVYYVHLLLQLVNIALVVVFFVWGFYLYYNLRGYVLMVFKFDMGHINRFPDGGIANLERSGYSDEHIEACVVYCNTIGRTTAFILVFGVIVVNVVVNVLIQILMVY